MPELDVLRRLGDEVVPPSLESLRATARRRDRRSSGAVIAAGAAAVVAVVVTTTVLGPDDDPRPSPVEPPRSEQAPSRPLTYAEGATIHYGDRTVTAEGRVGELDLTDQGVAFRTDDGRIWFTDGGAAEEIGALGEPVEPPGELEGWIPGFRYLHTDTSSGWVVSGNSGSHVMWFDSTDPGSPEVVVYDTDRREVVLRTAVDLPRGSWAGPHSVTEDSGYFFRDPDAFADDEMPQVRLDLATGEQTPISSKEYLADVGTPARSLVISHAEQGFEVYEVVEGPGRQLDVYRGRLRPMGMQPLEVRDGLSGDRLALRAPEGYPNANPIWLTQWLDDDSVVVLDPRGGQDRLLVCPVPAGTCELRETGPGSIVVPDLGGS